MVTIRGIRILLMALFAGAFLSLARGQTTATTATITDSDGQTWNNGKVTATFVPGPPQAYRWPGGMIPASVTGTMNGSGEFSISLPDNSTITPVGSMWNFSICPNASAACVSRQLPVSGSTQDISTQLSAIAKGPRFAAGPYSYGYLDVEVSPVPLPGASYWNVTNGVLREWTGSAWQNGGSGVSNEFVLSSAGTQDFATNLNSLYPMWSCFTKSGAQWTTTSVAPIDANDVAYTAAGATDTVCNFSAGGVLTPDFSLSVSPTSQTWTISGSGTQTPTYTLSQTALNGYTGTTTPSCTSLQAGMSCSYSPATITGSGTSTLSLSFPATQAAGTFSFNASATDGTRNHTTPVGITINALPSVADGWLMDEGTGSTFYTSSSTGNNITASGFTWGSVTGFPGSVPTFGGTDNSAVGANQTATNFDGTTPFSVCDWITPGVTTHGEALIGTLDAQAGTFQGWELGINASGSNTGAITAYIANSAPASNLLGVASPDDVIVTGDQYQVCMTYDGSQSASGLIIYLNGVAQSPTVLNNTLTATAANSIDVHLAGREDGTLDYTGTMADARIYDVELTASQVETLYAAGPQ